MELLRFDRADRLGTELLVVVVWVSATAALLADPVRSWWRDSALTINVGGDAASVVTVVDPTLADRVSTLLPSVIAVLALTLGAWLTVRLLRSISAGDPFERVAVRRLRIIAALLLLVPPAVAVGASLAASSVNARHDLGVSEFSITLPLAWMLAGLLVAAVAQAFVTGGALRDEVEGLV